MKYLAVSLEEQLTLAAIRVDGDLPRVRPPPPLPLFVSSVGEKRCAGFGECSVGEGREMVSLKVEVVIEIRRGWREGILISRLIGSGCEADQMKGARVGGRPEGR